MELPKLHKAASAAHLLSGKKSSGLKSQSNHKDDSRRQIETNPKVDPLHELNQCAIYNQRADHRQALSHAEQAISILEQEVLALRTKMESASSDVVITEAEKTLFLERTSLLSIAYYNKGCECEHLRKMIKATQAFSRAVNLQSGRHGNQVLLKQFKLSLKQSRYKLKQQMLPSSKSAQKRPPGGRASPQKIRPVSANFHFGLSSTEQARNHHHQTHYNYLLPGHQNNLQEMMVQMPERPQSAFQHNAMGHDQVQLMGAHAVNSGATAIAFSSSVSGGQHERIEELADSSMQNRKTVLSEYDAADLTSHAQNNPALFQMMHRPPRKGQQQARQQRLRGARQASQRRESSDIPRQKQGHHKSNGHGTSQPALFQVVDEVISSIEDQRALMSRGGQQIQSRNIPMSPDTNFYKTAASQVSNNSKKMLDRGGMLSLGSQTLFQPVPQALQDKPPMRKPETNKVRSSVVTTVVQDLVIKINQQTQQLSSPVLNQRQASPSRQKIQKIVSPTVVNQDVIAKPAFTSEEQKGLKTMQAIMRRRKTRQVVGKALDKKRGEDLAREEVGRDYKAFFESKKDDLKFQNACKMIQSLFKRRQFRSLTQQLLDRKRMEQSLMIVRVVTKFQAIFRRHQAQKRVELIKNQRRIEGSLTLMKCVVKIQSIFRRKRDQKIARAKQIEKWTRDPKFAKAALMIQRMIRCRRMRKLVNDVIYLESIRKDSSKMQTISNLQSLYRTQKAQRIVAAAMEQHRENQDPDYKSASMGLKSKDKRRQFRKTTWNDMYLKRISEHPKRLEYIVWVQSEFRRQKAKRIVYAMLTKKRMNDPKFLKAAIMIQKMYRRRKFRRLAYALLTQKRASDPKYNKAALMIQSLFRRRKYRNVADKVLWQIRMQKPQYQKAALMIQRVVRCRRMRKLVHDVIAQKKKLDTRITFVSCVVKIQSLWRRNRDNKRVDLQRISKKLSSNLSLMWQIVKIQRKFRRRRIQRQQEMEQRVNDPKYMKAVLMIQGMFRRRRFSKLINQVVKVQEQELQAGKKIASIMKNRRARKVVKAVMAQNALENLSDPPLVKRGDSFTEVAAQNFDQLSKGPLSGVRKQESFTEAAEEHRKMSMAKNISKQSAIKTISSQDAPSATSGSKKSLTLIVKTAGKKIINLNRATQPQRTRAAIRIQKWIRHTILRIKMRALFLKAAPILIKTFKQIGCFFKVVVYQKDEKSLLLKIATLPSNRQKQELIVDLPADKSIFFSVLEFAEQMIQQIEVSQFGKAKIATESLLRMMTPEKHPHMSFGGKALTFGEKPSPSPQMSPKLAMVTSKETIESVMLSPTLCRDSVGNQQSTQSKRSQCTIMANQSPIAFAPRSVEDSLITEMAPKLHGTISTEKNQQRVNIEAFSSKVSASHNSKVSNAPSKNPSLPLAPKSQQKRDPPKKKGDLSQDEDVVVLGRLQTRPPSGPSHSVKNAKNSTKPKKPESRSHIATAHFSQPHFSQTVAEQFCPAKLRNQSSLEVLPYNSDRGYSSHAQSNHGPADKKTSQYSVPKTIEHQKSYKENSVTSQSAAYRIMVQPEGLNDLRICFQPAVVKKKNFLMVTLFKLQVAVDRKILPIDIYSGTMATGLFDMDQFCQEWLMPCLTVKDKGKGKFCMEVNEQLLSEIQRKCDFEGDSMHRQPVSIHTVPQQQQQMLRTTSSMEMTPQSKIKQTTLIVPELQSFGQKYDGQLSLIKRTQILDSRHFNLQAAFDFDQNVMRFSANSLKETLNLNLHISTECPKELQFLHQKAEEIVNQLTITENGLELRRADRSVMRNDNVVYRTGKNMKGRFYVISVGFLGGQMLLEAYDKQREQRLVLRLDWNTTTEQKLTQVEANELVDKMDVMELAGNLMLVIR